AGRANRLKELPNNGRHQPDPDAPAVSSPPQDLSLLRPERAENRLQGCAPPAALHFRARQDRALAYHCCQSEEAARARQGNQARPLPGTSPLRGEVTRLRAGGPPPALFPVRSASRARKTSELGQLPLTAGRQDSDRSQALHSTSSL